MTGEDDFTKRLMGFGLTEKEAYCYLYLLKYGPKTPSPLAKALHTYREDTQRTLTALSTKGMVRSSPNSPTLYAAVDLESALEFALKKHESELREMERRKQELETLAQQQQFWPSEEVSTFKVLKDVKEIVTVTLPTVLSTREDFLWVMFKEGVQVASMFGVNSLVKDLTEQGGRARGITDITSKSMIPLVQELLEAGEDVRHFSGYNGLYFGVFDRRYSFSAINVDINNVRLDEPATMLYTDDSVYAEYLTSTFELLWRRAVLAEERIEELLKQS